MTPKTHPTVVRSAFARPISALIALSSLCLIACQTTPDQTETTTGSASERADDREAPRATADGAPRSNAGPALTPSEQLERSMVIGPAAARELGYRIIWESDRLISRGGRLVEAFDTGDAIFTLDSRNLLCRVRTEDGARVWASPVASAADRVFGLVRLQNDLGDRLHLTAEGAVWVVDAVTGVPADRHDLARVANTGSNFTAGRLIYGTRAGQIVWLDPVVGFPWRVRQLDGPIRSMPLVIDQDIAVVSGAGNVMVINGATAEVMWVKALLAGVSAAPAGDRGVLFVAGLDQYLWAFDQGNGRTLWKHFNDAPLTTGPVLIGDRLFQRLPNAGLVCFEAFPEEAPDGRRLWVNADVRGEVIGRRGRNLLVWDSSARRLSLLDAARGSLVNSVALPNVDWLTVTRPVDGDLLAINSDGRLIRLVAQ